MTPFEQNQEEIEKLIDKNISIIKNDNSSIKGKLLKTIVTEFENSKKYIHYILIIESNLEERINVNWSEIKTIEKYG